MRPYSGHAPGYVRDTFCDAIDAFMGWNEGEPEPMVKFLIQCEPRHIAISEACALVWNCTDILPRIEFDSLYCDAGLPQQRRTYAAAAQAMLAEIKRSRKQVEARSERGAAITGRASLLFSIAMRSLYRNGAISLGRRAHIAACEPAKCRIIQTGKPAERSVQATRTE